MIDVFQRLFNRAGIPNVFAYNEPSPSEINLKNITFCTGFWHIPQNKKRSLQHYLDLLPLTIEMIKNGKLLVFHDDFEFLSLCNTYAERHNVTMVGKQMALSQLPYFSLGDALLSSCKAMDRGGVLGRSMREKGVIHYYRDYLESGEESYKNLMSIWMSKVPLVSRHAITINPFGTPKYAWIDCSISRFNSGRKNWNFVALPYNNEKVYHYKNTMTYFAERLKLNASFLCGSTKAWKILDQLFEKYLLAHLSDAYAHDEETILNFVVNDHSHLFANCSKMRSVARSED
jgi:hypothetical protein